jgi:predicted nucleotide-binding protein
VALFLSYVDPASEASLVKSFIATLPDGEQKTLRNIEEFCLYYDGYTKSMSLNIYTAPRGTKSALEMIFVPDYSTDVGVRLPSRLSVENVHAIVARFDGAPMSSTVSQKVATADERQEAGQVTIFIGHGHDEQWRALKDFLQRSKGYVVVFYESEPRAGYSTIDNLQRMLNAANMALILHTAEDETKDGRVRARENTVHEAGLFQGKLGFSRAIILLEEGVEEYSNIQGLAQVRFPKDQISTAFGEVMQTIQREFPNV